MKQNSYCLIMGGGVGSRFWPESTEQKPKQFLDLLHNGKTLLRNTFERINQKTFRTENVYILTNKRYEKMVLEELPELSKSQIICEPQRKNTAPCIAYAAHKIHHIDPSAIFMVLPSDQTVSDEEAFNRSLRQGLFLAEKGENIVTLGIKPTYPATGYGYIQQGKIVSDGIWKVSEFREKPDLETAKTFINAGKYLWNAGIFIWSAQTVLNSFKKYCPKIAKIFEGDFYNTEAETSEIERCFREVEDISIDYAIMEKAVDMFVVSSDCGWSDLGSWKSVYALSEKDKNGNVLSSNSFAFESKNLLVHSHGKKKVVLQGVTDLVVVETEEYIMICNSSDEQKIKQISKIVLGK